MKHVYVLAFGEVPIEMLVYKLDRVVYHTTIRRVTNSFLNTPFRLTDKLIQKRFRAHWLVRALVQFNDFFDFICFIS